MLVDTRTRRSTDTVRSGSRPRILCVDDEPQILEGLRDVLRRCFDVRVAASGAEGLSLLRADPCGFAVVISDMRMPGMSGAHFLREAKRVAPLAVRMLLTGHADTDSAARAVNDGQIFRFLTKPCARDDLTRACVGAVWQHRVLAAERALLEQTLRGSVQALTDVLALANPAAFGRGARLKRLIAALARELGMADAWEIEVAAMLAQIGTVTLPEETAEKLYAGRPLSTAEASMVSRVPAATERILANIPRLEGVQQIVTAQQRRFDSIETEGVLPAGARILRIAIDYDDLHTEGVSPLAALETMRSRPGVYDVEMLERFAAIVGAAEHKTHVRELPVSELQVGMTLADDIRSARGRLLISRGYVVTQQLLERLRNFPRDEVRGLARVVDNREVR